MIFQKKCFSCYIILTDQILSFDCVYLMRYWTMYVFHLFANQVCDYKNFEINLIFLIKPFLYMTKNHDKNLNVWRTNQDFKVK